MYNIRSELQERCRNWHQLLFSGFCVVMVELIWYMFWWLDAEVNLQVLYCQISHIRSSRPELFCKKGVLRISQNSQESTCARVSFLIKFQASCLQLYLKRDSGTGFFLWIFRNFLEHLLLQNTSGGCFWLMRRFTKIVNE